MPAFLYKNAGIYYKVNIIVVEFVAEVAEEPA